MKLNATAEMMPVTWPEFANIHPYAPIEQTKGYLDLIAKLEDMLCNALATQRCRFNPILARKGNLPACSPFLVTINLAVNMTEIFVLFHPRHMAQSASAAMAGMRVVVVKCDADGNVDLDDLQAKAIEYGQSFHLNGYLPINPWSLEESIAKICEITHKAGGQVYVDGANGTPLLAIVPRLISVPMSVI